MTSQGDIIEEDALPEVASQRYEPVSVLGEGSFAITYHVRDRTSGEDLALKVLRVERIDDWKALELFEREANVLQRLDHPHIPGYADFHRDDEAAVAYLAQCLAPGRSIEEHLSDGVHFGRDELHELARQLLEILTYLETRRPPVVHRDLKPENLLYDGNQVYLVDFGAVREIERQCTGGSTVAGTFGYMAPEQLYGEATPASDLYALAMTLIHIATGIRPDELERDQMRPKFRDRADVSPAFAQLLERMTEPDAGERIQSAQECLQLLKGLDESADHVPAATEDADDAWRQGRDLIEHRGDSDGSDDIPSPVATGDDELSITTDGDARWKVVFRPSWRRRLTGLTPIGSEWALFVKLSGALFAALVIGVLFAALAYEQTIFGLLRGMLPGGHALGTAPLTAIAAAVASVPFLITYLFFFRTFVSERLPRTVDLEIKDGAMAVSASHLHYMRRVRFASPMSAVEVHVQRPSDSPWGVVQLTDDYSNLQLAVPMLTADERDRLYELFDSTSVKHLTEYE